MTAPHLPRPTVLPRQAVWAILAAFCLLGVWTIPDTAFAQPADLKSRYAEPDSPPIQRTARDSSLQSSVSSYIRATPDVIRLDGVLDEAAWQGRPLPLSQIRPSFGAPPSEETSVRIRYTDDALYVGARLTQTRSPIRSHSLYRDRYEGGDRFGLMIDRFNDDETGVLFWTTPTGIRGDASVYNDGVDTAIGDAVNANWDAHWTVETQVRDGAWTVEMRIPFSSLSYETKEGATTMGFLAFRDIAATGEQLAFPAVDPGYNLLSPSKAHDLILSDLPRGQQPTYVSPYLLGGSDHSAVRDASQQMSIGGDIRIQAGKAFVIDGTVNTDFAQVEADELRLNLTRFELFRPERRQFFQERAGLFAFPLLGFGPDRLFYSRRIGVSNGVATGILGGLRTVGRMGKWDLGAMSLQTEAASGEPSESVTVARVRRQISPRSTTGLLATARTDWDGAANLAVGYDADLRVFGDDFVTVRLAHIQDSDAQDNRTQDNRTSSSALLPSSYAQVQWERRVRRDFNYWFSATSFGDQFQPDLGFTTRTNVTELGWWLGYDWVMDGSSSLSTVSPAQVYGHVTRRNEDGSVETVLLAHSLDITWAGGFELSTDTEWRRENLREGFDLTDNVFVGPGTYDFASVRGGIETAEGQRWVAEIDVGAAGYYGGMRYTAEVEPTINVSAHLQIGTEYSYNQIRLPDGPVVHAHIARARIKSAVNRRLSMDGLVQYASTQQLLAGNVRIRYNAGEGRDIWLVFTERQQTRPLNARLRVAPEGRSVRLKLRYTFSV